eukprot:g207.t1
MVQFFSFLFLTLSIANGLRISRLNEQMVQSLDAFKDAASKIQQRFHMEQMDQNYGIGLPQEVVSEITKNSDEFWNEVSSISAEDVDQMSDEDAFLAQRLVNEVARLDEDLDDPQRLDKVVPEYQAVIKELHQLGLVV